MLFGTTPEHAFSLQKRAEALYAEGVKTEFLNSDALRETEPQLNAGVDGSAVLTPDDCQIDAHLAAAYFASVGPLSLSIFLLLLHYFYYRRISKSVREILSLYSGK